MPNGECDKALSDMRKPCCRRRGGGGGALVEPAALAALLYAGGYGYDMRKTILERTEGEIDVDVGGLYRSLRRLEEEGAVVSRWCDDETGPRRREYELTQQGVELAEQWLDTLRARRRLDTLLVELLEGGLEELGKAGDGPC
ncbi:PadR family transcriptional regulator [Eggerthella sp. YY7918]|uniref:PadR family transcriptional regulator n=1 Tax=Eggerthella sp. (strain YY7918) TaxID=502558 RepID=UPI00021712FF|nr:PadR family transcriptional regulator [Eggerthella sp. YY7918]BAK45301.1 predicted transcriptional regulator [Eggerthella sp. YY7918]